MPASDDLREGLAEAFDVLSDEFQSGAVVTLLRASTTDASFELVLEIETKRFFEYSNFRKNTLLEIADTSDELTDAIRASTHVSINTNEESQEAVTINGEAITINGEAVTIGDMGSGDIYLILQGDTLKPGGTNPVWQLYLELMPRNRGGYEAL
jgi:hypothetical protein